MLRPHWDAHIGNITLRLPFAACVRADTAIPTAPAAEPKMPVRGLCAHRGDAAAFPENTVLAIAAAARKGAAMKVTRAAREAVPEMSTCLFMTCPSGRGAT